MTLINPTARAVIYARVSTDEQAEEGYSLDEQLRLCREFCERKGWNVIAEYVDPGVSGTTVDRPAFQQMLADARLGKFDNLCVHKLDRFSRSLMDALVTLSNLSRYQVALCSSSEDFDFTTPFGKIVLAILVAFAQYFIDNLRAETKKGLRGRALKGFYNGTLSFGYQRVPKDQGGVPVIDRKNIRGYYLAVRMCLKGKNNREIADELNAKGYRTTGNRGNNLFIPDNIADMLHSRFYLGMVVYKSVWRAGKHKAALSPETWELVQISLRQRSSARDNTKTTDRIYPLRKLVHCARCGKPLRGQPQKGKRKYKDMTAAAHLCPQPQTVDALAIEAQLGDFLSAAKLPKDWRAQIMKRLSGGTDAAQIEAQRKRLQAEFTRARKLFIAGDLPLNEYEKDKARIQLALDKATPLPTQNFDSFARTLESAGTLWEKATDVQKMELARALFTKIWIRDECIVAVEPRAPFLPLFKLAEEEIKKSPQNNGDSVELSSGSDGRHYLNCVPITIQPPGSQTETQNAL
jgi:DNA invertase Pin-like site-specific DNA recombinase